MKKAKELSKEEHAVLNLIKANHRITQREIAKTEKYLHCHPKYEVGIGLKCEMESTLRRVRQIVRSLRLEHKYPILSDTKGYFLKATEAEKAEYKKRELLVSKAQSISWRTTNKVMQHIVK